MATDNLEQQIGTGDPLGLWEHHPAEWREYKLWDLAEYINGRSFKPIDFSPIGLSVIKITELKYGLSPSTSSYDGEYEGKYLLKNGDLLFAWSGNPETSLDAFRWRGGKALLNQHIFRVIPREDIDKTFLYFLLKYLRPTFIRTARDKATSMGHVKISDLKRLVAYIPPLPEQKAIASILGALDDKIELNRKMNETLEAMARAIFKSWFEDFDPIPGRGSHKEWQDSPLGKIPKGCKVEKIKECCGRVENGGTPRRDELSYWNPATVPWLTSGEVRQDIVISTNNKISEKGLANSSAKLWPKGTTVVALYGATAGQVCFLANEMCANQACCGLVPLPNMQFFNYLCVSSSVQKFEQLARGSAQQNLSQQIVADLKVIIPDTTTAEKFEELVKPLFDIQILNLEQSRTLSSIRDVLLPKLLSGEIRVKDAERYAETNL